PSTDPRGITHAGGVTARKDAAFTHDGGGVSQSHNEAFTRDGGTTPENTAIPPVDSPTAGDSQSLERVQREGEREREIYAEDVQINREGLVTQLLAQLSPAERSNPSFVSTWQGRTETDPMICIACLRELE